MTSTDFLVIVFLAAGTGLFLVDVGTRIYARGIQRGVDLALNNLGKTNLHIDFLYHNNKMMIELRSASSPLRPAKREKSS